MVRSVTPRWRMSALHRLSTDLCRPPAHLRRRLQFVVGTGRRLALHGRPPAGCCRRCSPPPLRLRPAFSRAHPWPGATDSAPAHGVSSSISNTPCPALHWAAKGHGAARASFVPPDDSGPDGLTSITNVPPWFLGDLSDSRLPPS